MRKEMGNQNTSGIIEEKAANETVEGTSSTNGLKNENEILIQENGTKDIHERNAEIDSHDVQSDKSSPVERLASGENVSEEVNGSIDEDRETHEAALLHVSTKDEESKDSNLEGGGASKFNDEVNDQQSHEKGDVQRIDLKLEQKFTSNIINSNSVHEAVDNTSEPQEELNMLVTERVDTLESSNLGSIEEEGCLVEAKLEQNIEGSVILEFDDHDAKKNEDEMMVTEMASREDATIEMITDKEKSNAESTDNITNVRMGPPKAETDSCIAASNDIANRSSLDITAANDEPPEDRSVLNEEKSIVHELGNDKNSSSVNQTDQLQHQPLSQSVYFSNDQSETNQSDIEKSKEEPAIGFDSISWSGIVNLVDGVKEKDIRDHIGLSSCDKSIPNEELEDPDKDNDTVKKIRSIQTECSVEKGRNQEEDNLIDQSTLEKVLPRDEPLLATADDNESKISIMEECSSKPQNIQPIPSKVTEVEIPPILFSEQNPNSEESISDVVESDKGHESAERLSIESNKRESVEVVLRKSPSFDFGLPFRSEESDQTPLLYHDRTNIRSFSLQHTNVKSNYFGKSLHHEAVAMEEKTIRMERSNSENLVKKVDKANVVMQEKQVNSASDKMHENGSKGSPSEEDRVVTSPKGNGKRKLKSSLFATCICCTTAIS